MPIDEDGCLVNQTPTSTQAVDIGAGAPPLYGDHVLDQIYGGIDPNGYMTPGPGTQSGVNTPFYTQSRSGSFENLSSLDGVANNAVPPSALSARLHNLNGNGTLSRNNSFMRRQHHSGSGGNTPHPIPEEMNGHESVSQPGYFDLAPNSTTHSRAHSVPNSNPISRRPSDEIHPDNHTTLALHPPTPGTYGMSNPTSGTHTPEHIDYPPNDLEILNKVPSYTTALKTPLRGLSYHEQWDLPNYETAISRPSSPVRGTSTGHLTPEVLGSPTRGHANGTTPPSGSRSPSARPQPAQRPHSVLGLTGLTGLTQLSQMIHGHGPTPLAPVHLPGTGIDDATRTS